ncbi:MAG: hypothetical protein P4L69_18315 [Desulfosporosinus sp.]|nr:hypothetical protein [Desulfosporosinus sp.]
MFQITLREARELRGYTIEDVALVCDIAVCDIMRYELDASKIPFNLAKRLKRLYRNKLEQIFMGLEAECIKSQCLKRAPNVPACLKRT